VGLLQERAHVIGPEPQQQPEANPRAMDLSSYASATATNSSSSTSSTRPRGHIWSTRLGSWVVPITRKGSRRPSPDHIFCSEPPCWLLIEPLDPASTAS
jgi:hypothetical protein